MSFEANTTNGGRSRGDTVSDRIGRLLRRGASHALRITKNVGGRAAKAMGGWAYKYGKITVSKLIKLGILAAVVLTVLNYLLTPPFIALAVASIPLVIFYKSQKGFGKIIAGLVIALFAVAMLMGVPTNRHSDYPTLYQTVREAVSK